jgi:hypothetical protein
MKKIFRYLTAEINGFYLSSLHNFMNDYITPVLAYCQYLSNVQFKTESDELSGYEEPMEDSDIRGIAKTCGVFNPFISAESNLGSLLFTTSKKVSGIEYSERGLFDMKSESFKFFRTNQGVYTTDIVSLASSVLRASLVPENAPVLGYIEEGTQVLTEDGQLIYENILADPPVGKAYYNFYGEKYLILAETFLIEAFLDTDTFKSMVETYQRIRYNGVSIKELVFITKLLMQDYVCDVYFVASGSIQEMHYKLDIESELPGKTKRVFIWRDLLDKKFKQLVAVEDIA